MAEREVEVTISSDGSVIKTDAIGFEGHQCIDKIGPILESLGSIENQEEKPELHNKAGTGIRAGNG